MLELLSDLGLIMLPIDFSKLELIAIWSPEIKVTFPVPFKATTSK